MFPPVLTLQDRWPIPQQYKSGWPPWGLKNLPGKLILRRRVVQVGVVEGSTVAPQFSR